MKEQIKKILRDYGINVIIIKNNDSYNDYGEVLFGEGTQTSVKGVLTNTSNKFILRYLGLDVDKDFSLLLPYDVDVQKGYIVIVDNKRYKISSISPLYFKGEIVVYVLNLI